MASNNNTKNIGLATLIATIMLGVGGWFFYINQTAHSQILGEAKSKLPIEQYRTDQKDSKGRFVRMESKIDKILEYLYKHMGKTEKKG